MNSDEIKRFLRNEEWLRDVDRVEFLAAGEYNENYLVHGSNDSGESSRDDSSGENRFVFRINHGSQLGIDNQIGYEFEVLRTVDPTGLTPRALYVRPADAELPGVMLMTYIPGGPFAYEDDLKAAYTLAKVHSVDISSSLIVQENPVLAICDESIGLFERYPDHPLRHQGGLLRRYHDRVAAYAEETFTMLQNESMCVVNTELNSGNFIRRDRYAYLVDWEKAVISHRYQDLSHFLVPTTTLWKTDFKYTDDGRRKFIDAYRRFAGLELPAEELFEKTRRMEQVILLRALSWCYMAFYEYTREDRTIRNDDTFQRIRQYMDELEWFLK